MRKGMNGLALQVQQALGRDPHAGDLYVFRGARGDLINPMRQGRLSHTEPAICIVASMAALYLSLYLNVVAGMIMATIGYARTSTRDQEAGLQAQIRDLIAAGCAERDIYTEQASSVRERPELDLLRRRILRPGDELVVTRLDRLARSARDTLALAEEFGQRGVTLKILDPAMTIEPPGRVNGSMASAMSRMILTVMAAMAQLEREIMLERQREGIARAKAEGKYKGQPPHARAKAPQVIELAAAGRTRAEIAAALEISERSVYRILAETRPKTI
jgi:DNA invertase Pin-like site-specific DNA recombinase